MKNYINLSSDYYLPQSRSSESSQSITSISSVSSRSISRSVKSFTTRIGAFLLFNVSCCFFISLANFAFNEKLAKLVQLSLDNESSVRNRIPYNAYQNYLHALEIGCWIIPLVVYLLWSKVSSWVTVTLCGNLPIDRRSLTALFPGSSQN